MIRVLAGLRRYSAVPPLLTAAQVAARLGVSVWTVRKLVREGKLPAISLNGGPFRFRSEDVDALCTPNVGAAA